MCPVSPGFKNGKIESLANMFAHIPLLVLVASGRFRSTLEDYIKWCNSPLGSCNMKLRTEKCENGNVQ